VNLMVDNVGVPNLQPPKKECSDPYCPFHGTRKVHVRGRIFKGEVISTKMTKTIVVSMNYYIKDKKYERLARARSKIAAHLPDCIDVKEGDYVRIMETRPLAKTVTFVVLDKISKEAAK
jgi:small subunit ribosomal protein S17